MQLPASKSRGAVFTPPAISAYISSWAIRTPDDLVLEPSCGEASFLTAAINRLVEIDKPLFPSDKRVVGVEIHADSVKHCRSLLHKAEAKVDIHQENFFDFLPEEKFDAVIGNPPYIRYQLFTGENRAKALRAGLAQGISLSGLSSSWAAFVLHAARLLKDDGRLGFVLPAELLTTNYAAPVRRFLLDRFSSIKLVTFEQRIFPDALEDAVLLLAEGRGSCDHFKVYSAKSADSLKPTSEARWHGVHPKTNAKWSAALGPTDSSQTLQSAVSAAGFVSLTDWGNAFLGSVTGNNKYFAMTAAEADDAKIPLSELQPISPPGSRHLRGFTFTQRAWQASAEGGAKCFLFAPKVNRQSKAALTYIEQGESSGVQAAYKCSVRKPWWRVPQVVTPDLFITYMDADRPRFVRNSAGVKHLNSLYGFKLKKGKQKLGRDLLPLVTINSVTLLAAELNGRAFGGGLLKLEPREADGLPVPTKDQIAKHSAELRGVMPQAGKLIGQGRLYKASQLVDSILFSDNGDFAPELLDAVRTARTALSQRRASRSKK